MSERTIWLFLADKLGNEYGAAGLMGNLKAESGLISTNLQNSYQNALGFSDLTYTKAVDDGSYTNFEKDKAGYGLAQWTYWSRKRDLLNYAKKTCRSIGDETMQLEFLVQELQKSFKDVWNTLRTSKSVKEASDIVLTQFERPANMNEANKKRRANIGQQIYDTYATKYKMVKVELPVLKKGAKCEAVKTVQTLLGIEVDGSFGGDTDRAVKEYQKEHGMTPDGSVGAGTWSLLLNG
jgi:peptidoglycan hydrolase-like protein with peptidoglycan-binding domain